MKERNVYVIQGEAAPGPGDHESSAVDAHRRQRRRGARKPSAVAGAHGGMPRFGASCSMLMNGSGHLLHRRWGAGCFYLLVFACALAVPYLLRLAWPLLDDLLSDNGMGEVDLLVGLALLDVFFVAVLLSGVHTAFTTARSLSGDHSEPRPHPLGPAVASLLVPGWGQIINGQLGKALAFLFVVYAGGLAALAWLTLPGPIERTITQALANLPQASRPLVVPVGVAVIAAVTWALSVYDAVLVARYRADAGAPARRPVRRQRRARRTPAAALTGAR